MSRSTARASGGREAFRLADRMRQRGSFVRCYRRGHKRHGRLLSLHAHANDQGKPRLGITASRKVGIAVVRHRLKRWSREIFRRGNGRRSLPSLDIVVHLKPQAARASFPEFRSELERLLDTFASAERVVRT